MKTGINVLLWTTKIETHDFPLLQTIKSLGYDSVEIPIVDLSTRYYQKLSSTLQDLGLETTTVIWLSADKNPISPDKTSRIKALDTLKKGVDCSHILHASLMGGPFHSAYKVFSGVPPSDQELNLSAEVMHDLAEYAKDAKVIIAPEILNRFECYLINTCEQARVLCERVNHPNFGIHYDTHHAHIEEKNIVDALHSIKHYLKHIHISENDRGVPGQGQVRWKDTFSTLHKIAYEGSLTVEAFEPNIPSFSEGVCLWRSPSPMIDVITQGIKFIQDTYKIDIKNTMATNPKFF